MKPEPPVFPESHDEAHDVDRSPWVRLALYLTGELNASERAEMERWIASDAELAAIVAAEQEKWAVSAIPENGAQVEAAFAKVTRRVGVVAEPRGVENVPSARVVTDHSALQQGQARRMLSRNALRRSPVSGGRTLRRDSLSKHVIGEGQWTWRKFLLGSGAVALAWLGFSTVRWDTSDAGLIRGAYRAPPGRTIAVRLADGSRIVLAPATTVTIRTTGIDVHGEAYFAINPHASHPVVVTTSRVMIQVLGTRFGVRQYPGESRSRVVVEDGRVGLRLLRHDQTLERHTIISARTLAFVTDSGVIVQPGIAPVEYTGWLHGILVFDGIPLREAVIELNRAYGADIRIADSLLAEKPIVAKVIVPQRPLIQVLEAICDVMGAHYVRSGSAFVLSQGSRNSEKPSGQMWQNRFPQQEKQYGR